MDPTRLRAVCSPHVYLCREHTSQPPGLPRGPGSLHILESLTAQRSAATHGCESSRELGILLLDIQLGAGGLSVADGVYDLCLGTSELTSTLEVLQGLRDLALLEEELGEGCDGDVTFGVD